jgi:flavin-binding protein dodecin
MKEATMADATYAVSEIVGTSPEGVDTAIQNGLKKAAESLRNLDWFEVTDIRGQLGTDDGTVQHYQVTLKVGFRYDD